MGSAMFLLRKTRLAERCTIRKSTNDTRLMCHGAMSVNHFDGCGERRRNTACSSGSQRRGKESTCAEAGVMLTLPFVGRVLQKRGTAEACRCGCRGGCRGEVELNPSLFSFLLFSLASLWSSAWSCCLRLVFGRLYP
jgi:hypothetical protein